ncbi:MAG TPA: NADH-quinone oxidoreductase subunit NuoG [Roseiflexaceae bacterium]|nr:NADH-quinone oxidoreductase subunit NuoG [Roseiflexaceae bacterium]
MPDVNLVIDGQAVTVPAGTNIVDAARSVNSAIPVFCYHPKLPAVGMCRMCLVEVWTPKIDPATRQPVLDENGKPVLALMMNKLQPGCVTPVSEGMEVRTRTDKVEFAQKGMLEFLLTSHPLDCPVCDKGGECPLQNLTMRWGPAVSRFDYEDKVHFQKPIPLGELIYLDRERCILCSRCVRFEDEIAGDPVLGFDNRGRSWEIIAKGEPPFDSKFSGNTTDICPVGALTTSDFRFKARVWELQPTPSVCTLCPVGCDITLDMRHNNLMRVMPRENDFVNEIWICDKGRFGMRHIGHEDRLTSPMIRRNNELVPASWDEALALVAERLGAARGQVGGIAGAGLSNEDYFGFARLFREALGSANLDYRSGAADDPAVDTWSQAYGVGQGTNLMTLGKGTAVLIVGADPEEEAPVYVLRTRAIQARGGDVTVINPYPTKLGRSATRSIQPRPGTGPQVVLALLKALSDANAFKVEQYGARLRGFDTLRSTLANASLEQLAEQAGVAADSIRAAADAFAAAENGIIFVGRLALAVGAPLVDALAALAVVTGKVGRANNGLIVLSPGGNVNGAIDMGVAPVAAGKNGLSSREMLAGDGRVKAMFVAGSDPAAGNPVAAAALDGLDFLVVQDMFLTETAQRADVVLPLAAIGERDGSTTNAERRVQRFRLARRPEHDLRAVWQVAQAVAALVAAPVAAGARNANVAVAGEDWGYSVAEDVIDAIAASVPAYRGADADTLTQRSGTWGRQLNESIYYDGTSYENIEGVGVQLASGAEDGKSALQVGLAAPAAASREANTLVLMGVPRAYDGGDWARGSKLAPRMVPPHIIVSMADAERLGLAIGGMATVQSSGGAVTLPIQIDLAVPQGTVLVPIVHGANLGALATGAITDVSITRSE